MCAQKNKPFNLTIDEAVTALSEIAELQDWDKILSANEGYRDVKKEETGIIYELLLDNNIDRTTSQIRVIFSVVLEYIDNIYKQNARYAIDKRTIEGIKNILYIVGEATRKLQRIYSLIEQPSTIKVTELPEYKKLQEFYQKKIDIKVDESTVGQWILGIAHQNLSQEKERIHAKPKNLRRSVVELDKIKNDVDYELLLISKEDGTRFYNPELIRNMKLVCDFGGSISHKEADILSPVKFWRERICYQAANQILKYNHAQIGFFYKVAFPNKDFPLVSLVNKALIALMLSSHLYTFGDRDGEKSSLHYWKDFLDFFRECLNHQEYQKLLLYPPNEDQKVQKCILKTMQSLSVTLYQHLKLLQKLTYEVDEMIHQASLRFMRKLKIEEKTKLLHHQLTQDYTALTHILKNRVEGPLIRDLTLILEEGSGFDTLMQDNLPQQWFNLVAGEFNVACLRMSSPTNQTQIDGAEVYEEFKNFLIHNSHPETRGHHLLINLQDRNSWKEQARAKVLENLQHSILFDKSLTTISLPVSNDFYLQKGPYAGMDDAEGFKENLLKELKNDSSGFYIPENWKVSQNPYFPKFLDGIHHVFFAGEAMLNQMERINFISIFYLLFTLKMIENTQATSFSMTCKDGIDLGCSFEAMLFIFLYLMNREVLSEQISEFLNVMIHAAPILIRERAMLPDPFHRLTNMVECIEKRKHMIGLENLQREFKEHLAPLFRSEIYNAYPDIT
ncbi:MAG: hypothetical protein Tsb0021_05830 [Chlamydiales bacterium]